MHGAAAADHQLQLAQAAVFQYITFAEAIKDICRFFLPSPALTFPAPVGTLIRYSFLKGGPAMATEAKLRQLADRGCPVYYFYSSERYLVRQAVSAAVRILSADTDEETTVLDGAAPEIEQLIMAAGTISFFGTRRVVVLPELDPAAYGEQGSWRSCAAPLPAWKMPWWCWAVCSSWSAASSSWASRRKSCIAAVQEHWLRRRTGKTASPLS